MFSIAFSARRSAAIVAADYQTVLLLFLFIGCAANIHCTHSRMFSTYNVTQISCENEIQRVREFIAMGLCFSEKRLQKYILSLLFVMARRLPGCGELFRFYSCKLPKHSLQLW